MAQDVLGSQPPCLGLLRTARQRSLLRGASFRLVFLALTAYGGNARLDAAPAAAAAGSPAAAPEPNLALDKVLGRLRGAAETSATTGIAEVQALATHTLQQFNQHADAAIHAASPQHAESIKGVGSPAEAALGAIRDKFQAARAEASIRAKLTAHAEMVAVQKEAEQEMRTLKKQATTLQAEGATKLADADGALLNLQKASQEVEHWRSQWPKESINNAIGLSKEAEQVAPQMQRLAAQAEALDADIDRRAIHVLKTVSEALHHSQQAALVARSALDQAEQNAIKLQGIRGLIDGASAANDAATERAVEAAVR